MGRDWHDQLTEIHRRHAASVYRRARALLGSEIEAMEVVQDLFVSLLERPKSFDGRSELHTYLYSATTHACLNRLRNERTRARLMAERISVLDIFGRPALDDLESLVTLRAALSRLPEQLAVVAVYYYIDELNHQEIADILGCSRRTVGYLLERLSAWTRAQEEAC